MDPQHRENFRTWFRDVGYLYLIVVVAIGLLFFVRDIGRHFAPLSAVDTRSRTEIPYGHEP